MKVSALIKELNKLDQEAEVVMKFRDEVVSILDINEDEGIENINFGSENWDLLTNYTSTRDMENFYDTDELAFVNLVVFE